MPTLKFVHVVSCSSEDTNHPADNLIKTDTYRKWKCKIPGEKQATVVLQLEKSSDIVGVDIGNENSAFVEVLVGRSSTDEFKVLLVSSSFMSPMEGRNGTNTNRVRMFTKEHLSKPALDEKWDRVKVVCTQPFSKHVQYGLSFIAIYGSQDKNDDLNSTSKLGRFALKNDDTESLLVGSLFARRNEVKAVEAPLKGAAAVREASSPAVLLRQHNQSSVTESKRHIDKASEKQNQKINKTSNPSVVNITPINIQTTKKKLSDKAESSTSTKRPSVDQNRFGVKTKKCKVPAEEPATRRPFKKLLEGVVLVISGYQNPHRANVRSMALDMGARYKPDWDASCTHLVCAFPNTPKFQQVHGKGCIVNKEWVENCHHQRRRLQWRRYALTKQDQEKDDSEEEILEAVPQNPTDMEQEMSDCETETEGFAGGTNADSGSDTEEEIERIRLGVNSYGGDTEVESGSESERFKPSLPWPHLPDLFSCKKFFLQADLPADVHSQLKRYIIAFKGLISPRLSAEVHYMVTHCHPNVKKVKAEYPSILAVEPAWVWRCHNQGKLIPSTPFQVE